MSAHVDGQMFGELVLERLAEGASECEVAREFGVSVGEVEGVVSGARLPASAAEALAMGAGLPASCRCVPRANTRVCVRCGRRVS